MNLSKHAEQRIQERSIPPLVVEWLHDYGSRSFSHGAEKLYFDRESKRRLSRVVGHQVISRMGDLLDCYIVLNNEDRVVTAARRTKRIRQ